MKRIYELTAFCLSISLFVYTIVRCFFCNMNVMGMTFFKRSCRNLHKSACSLQCLNVFSSAQTHTRTKSSKKLENGVFHITLCKLRGLPPLPVPAFGITLEITVFGTILHSRDGSHSTVYFIFSSLIQFGKIPDSHHNQQRYFPSCRHSHLLRLPL